VILTAEILRTKYAASGCQCKDEQRNARMRIGIACSAGSYKGVFVHGVLAGLNERGFKVDIYAASSSTAAAAAYAAVGDLPSLKGPEHWSRMYAGYLANDYDVSKAVLEAIPEYTERLQGALFSQHATRFAVAVSAVITKEAEESTQGLGARRLGQQLVLATRKRDRSWADKHLQVRLFETGNPSARFKLTPQNMNEVFYATTRMLHAWKAPAWIDGQPYVDASYTCTCPALQLAEMGCAEIVAISPEVGTLYRDFFQSVEMPSRYLDARIHLVRPRRELADMGVDYMKVTDEGLHLAYELGVDAGEEFAESCAISTAP
jgi:predicted patatin/cPLA2 family phospholipase